MPAAKRPRPKVPHEKTIVGMLGMEPKKIYRQRRKRQDERAAREAAKWNPRPYSERKKFRQAS